MRDEEPIDVEFTEIREPLQIEEAMGDWRLGAKPLPEPFPYWTYVIVGLIATLVICWWNGYF